MERFQLRLGGILSALLAAAVILVSAGLLAEGLRGSELYSGSRFLSEILSRDGVELSDFASDLESVDMLFQFAGAVTSAYIDFELIPVGEADTFVAVLESRPASVRVDRFEYHGRNLSIFGTAPARKDCDEFVSRLSGAARFESVTGSSESAAGGGVSFRIDAFSHGSAGS